MAKKQSIKRRLLAYVAEDLDTGCWICTRCKDQSGYAFMHALGQNFAHRVAFLLFNGPIPEGLKVLHTCDNPSCVNPEHLFVGTQKDNQQDAKRKDRHSRGPRNGMCQIPTGLIEPIRRARNEERRLLREVAEEFGISTSQVSVIARGIQRTIA